MVLEPLPDEGYSGLAIAPDHSQLLSPNLDNLPNLASQENPLRQLLAEEREYQLWGRRDCSRASSLHPGPFHLSLFMPPHRMGVRSDCFLSGSAGLPADTLLPGGPAAGGHHS